MSPKIERFLLELPEHKRQLAMELREIFLACDQRITEDIKWNNLTFIYKGSFAFIYTFNKLSYMNVGFFRAVELSDPQELFEGSGKTMRHVKIHTPKDIKKTWLKKWIKESMGLNELSEAQKSTVKKGKKARA